MYGKILINIKVLKFRTTYLSQIRKDLIIKILANFRVLNIRELIKWLFYPMWNLFLKGKKGERYFAKDLRAFNIV